MLSFDKKLLLASSHMARMSHCITEEDEEEEDYDDDDDGDEEKCGYLSKCCGSLLVLLPGLQHLLRSFGRTQSRRFMGRSSSSSSSSSTQAVGWEAAEHIYSSTVNISTHLRSL